MSKGNGNGNGNSNGNGKGSSGCGGHTTTTRIKSPRLVFLLLLLLLLLVFPFMVQSLNVFNPCKKDSECVQMNGICFDSRGRSGLRYCSCDKGYLYDETFFRCEKLDDLPFEKINYVYRKTSLLYREQVGPSVMGIIRGKALFPYDWICHTVSKYCYSVSDRTGLVYTTRTIEAYKDIVDDTSDPIANAFFGQAIWFGQVDIRCDRNNKYRFVPRRSDSGIFQFLPNTVAPADEYCARCETYCLHGYCSVSYKSVEDKETGVVYRKPRDKCVCDRGWGGYMCDLSLRIDKPAMFYKLEACDPVRLLQSGGVDRLACIHQPETTCWSVDRLPDTVTVNAAETLPLFRRGVCFCREHYYPITDANGYLAFPLRCVRREQTSYLGMRQVNRNRPNPLLTHWNARFWTKHPEMVYYRTGKLLDFVIHTKGVMQASMEALAPFATRVTQVGKRGPDDYHTVVRLWKLDPDTEAYATQEVSLHDYSRQLFADKLIGKSKIENAFQYPTQLKLLVTPLGTVSNPNSDVILVPEEYFRYMSFLEETRADQGLKTLLGNSFYLYNQTRQEVVFDQGKTEADMPSSSVRLRYLDALSHWQTYSWRSTPKSLQVPPCNRTNSRYGFPECEMSSWEECQEKRCNSRGRCLFASAACICNEGWYGPDCSMNAQECREQRCTGSGDCQDQFQGCKCDAWRSGYNCKIWKCAPNLNDPLKPHVYNPVKRACNCSASYVGFFCEFKKCGPHSHVDMKTSQCVCHGVMRYGPDGKCSKNICQPFGTYDAKDKDKCICNSNYIADFSFSSSTAGVCVPKCLNGGILKRASRKCVCPFSYYGTFCEVYLTDEQRPQTETAPIETGSTLSTILFVFIIFMSIIASLKDYIDSDEDSFLYRGVWMHETPYDSDGNADNDDDNGQSRNKKSKDKKRNTKKTNLVDGEERRFSLRSFLQTAREYLGEYSIVRILFDACMLILLITFLVMMTSGSLGEKGKPGHDGVDGVDGRDGVSSRGPMGPRGFPGESIVGPPGRFSGDFRALTKSELNIKFSNEFDNGFTPMIFSFDQDRWTFDNDTMQWSVPIFKTPFLDIDRYETRLTSGLLVVSGTTQLLGNATLNHTSIGGTLNVSSGALFSSTLVVKKDTEIHQSLVVKGKLETEKNLHIKADLIVDGSANISGILFVHGVEIQPDQWPHIDSVNQSLATTDSPRFKNLLVDERIEVTDLDVSGTLGVSLDTTLSRDLHVLGTSTLDGDLTLSGLLNAHGTEISASQWPFLDSVNQNLGTSSGPSFASLTVGGTASFQGTTVLSGTLDAHGTLITAPQWPYIDSVNQNLGTTDTPHFQGLSTNTITATQLTSSAAVTVTSNAGITITTPGLIQLQGSLGINIDTALHFILDVAGNTDINAGEDLTLSSYRDMTLETTSSTGVIYHKSQSHYWIYTGGRTSCYSLLLDGNGAVYFQSCNSQPMRVTASSFMYMYSSGRSGNDYNYHANAEGQLYLKSLNGKPFTVYSAADVQLFSGGRSGAGANMGLELTENGSFYGKSFNGLDIKFTSSDHFLVYTTGNILLHTNGNTAGSLSQLLLQADGKSYMRSIQSQPLYLLGSSHSYIYAGGRSSGSDYQLLANSNGETILRSVGTGNLDIICSGGTMDLTSMGQAYIYTGGRTVNDYNLLAKTDGKVIMKSHGGQDFVIISDDEIQLTSQGSTSITGNEIIVESSVTDLQLKSTTRGIQINANGANGYITSVAYGSNIIRSTTGRVILHSTSHNTQIESGKGFSVKTQHSTVLDESKSAIYVDETGEMNLKSINNQNFKIESQNDYGVLAWNDIYWECPGRVDLYVGGTNNAGGKFTVHGNMEVTGDLNVVGELSAGVTSDRRLKTDIEIQSTRDSLNQILALTPVEYKYKRNTHHEQGDKHHQNRLEFGFIAQDMEHIFPSLVVKENSSSKTDWIKREFDISEPDVESIRATEGIYTLKSDPMQLVSKLVAAIQEQQSQLQTLQARIEVLESNCRILL